MCDPREPTYVNAKPRPARVQRRVTRDRAKNYYKLVSFFYPPHQFPSALRGGGAVGGVGGGPGGGAGGVAAAGGGARAKHPPNKSSLRTSRKSEGESSLPSSRRNSRGERGILVFCCPIRICFLVYLAYVDVSLGLSLFPSLCICLTLLST